MADPRFANHNLIASQRGTLAMIVEFIHFTGSTWYGSRSKQANAFAGNYPGKYRDSVVKAVMIVMDNYGIDGVVSERTTSNAWNIALDAIGVDPERLEREREHLRTIEGESTKGDAHGPVDDSGDSPPGHSRYLV